MQTIYSEVTAVTDSVYLAIDERGTTDQSVIDFVQQSARQASGELESDFLFLISDTVPFTSPPDWFVELANKLTEAYFWEKQNGSTQMIEEVQKKIDQERERRFGQAPAITRGDVT